MRGPLAWLLAAVGVIAVIVVVAAIGGRDRSGETVSAGAWAQSVCGAVGVWRADMRTILNGVRQAPALGGSTEEPQSETKRGRSGAIRRGLDQAVRATTTLVTGIENAGTPDTPQGEEAADRVSTWADDALDDLEDAQDALDDEAEDLEDAIEQLGDAAVAIGSTLASGVRTLTEVARLDPELEAALRDSSTCQRMREKEQSA